MSDLSVRTVRWGQLTAGIVVVVVGVLLLLDRFDVALFRDLFELWPLIVVGVGVIQLIGADRREKQRSAFVVIFIGLWLLLTSLRLFGLGWGDSWPLAIVAVGLASVIRPDRRGDVLSGLLTIGTGVVLFALTRGWLGLTLSNGWPLFVIFGGLALVIRSLRGPRGRRSHGA